MHRGMFVYVYVCISMFVHAQPVKCRIHHKGRCCSQLGKSTESPYRKYGEIGMNLRDMIHFLRENDALAEYGEIEFPRANPLAKYKETEVFPEHPRILPNCPPFYPTTQCT